ncbi:serine-type endopeptidase activity protein [Homalodisca vitripennis]|nr:serine-type endopeptidase activity protein [Homalodisca vitripennis]
MRGAVVCACVCIALQLCVLLVVQVDCQLVHTPSNSFREENEECRREGEKVWLCKRDKDCRGARKLLQSGGKLVSCFWKDPTTHIVCCPPEEPVNRVSVSEKKCAEFQKVLCQQQGRRGLLKRSVTQLNQLPGIGRKLSENKEFSNILHNMNTTAKPRGMFAIGGAPSKPKEFTNMAIIGYGDKQSISWQCGGSLISERYVLSAAHCSLTGYGLARWVRLGDLDISTDKDDARPQQFEIIERIVHSGYKAPAFYNDIVLFRLDRAAVFDDYVRPACLHTGMADLTGVGVATGWGRNESNGPTSPSLVKVGLKFLSSEECQRVVGTVERYLPAGLDTQTMLCAGEPGKDTCQGDSGGPLMLTDRLDSCLNRQVGVTSFGPKNCGMAPAPGAYVRVAHFVRWIESVVWAE